MNGMIDTMRVEVVEDERGRDIDEVVQIRSKDRDVVEIGRQIDIGQRWVGVEWRGGHDERSGVGYEGGAGLMLSLIHI